MKKISILLIVLTFISCKNKQTEKVIKVVDSLSTKEKEVYHICGLSVNDFAFSIDSCNCSEINTFFDTIFISISPLEGGEIQGKLLKIRYPICDSSYYIIKKHQNRYWVSSMGPDPLLTDWILYNSPNDTIKYDKTKQGFYIDTIPQAEQQCFPKFDTLDFYKAYKRALDDNMNMYYTPSIAIPSMLREYNRNKGKVKEILEESGAELHRIIFILKKGEFTQKVIIVSYSHVG